jgi:hypothetical protein
MKSRVALLIWAVLMPMAGEAAAQDIQLQPFRPQEEIAASPQAARAFSRFQQAWSGKNAGRIADLIPADSRATVTIEGRGVSSQMSRGQIEALLNGLFSEAQRAAFDLSTIHLSDETSAYAVGDWTYESRNPGQRERATVFVVFRQTLSGSWILSELRIRPAR